MPTSVSSRWFIAMPKPEPSVIFDALLDVAGAASQIATYCDRAEHAEAADRASVISAAGTLRRVAATLANAAGEDLDELYAARLARVERRHPCWPVAGYDGGAEARSARGLHALQAVQLTHDRHYHPDVYGLARTDQLRHNAFHLAKLTGALAALVRDEAGWETIRVSRLPDLFLFGLKLSTLMGERIGD